MPPPSSFQLSLAVILSGLLGYVIHRRIPNSVGDYLASSDIIPFLLIFLIGALTINVDNLTPHIIISLIIVSFAFALLASHAKNYIKETLSL